MHSSELNYVVTDTLKHSFLSQLKTGNFIIDTIIGFLVMTFITTIMSKMVMTFSSLKLNLLRYLYDTHDIMQIFRPRNAIKITGQKITNVLFSVNARMEFSVRFYAIIHLINSIVKRDTMNNIRQLVELQTREHIKYNNETNMNESEKEFSFIVDQRQVIYLEEDIYCTVECTSEHAENENKQSVIRDIYDITIYSYKHTCKDLFDYLDKITDAYENEQKLIKNKHKYILSYGGVDDLDVSNGIKWNVEQFRSNKQFDNMFFDEKPIVIQKIKDFIAEKDLYKRIGKPYHLGIVLYGEPGCGKTSFINALANELGRSIKEINFSKLKTVDDLERSITCTEYNNIDMDYDKVIISFEDIDCATNIVKSRKLTDTDKEDEGDKTMLNMVKAFKKLSSSNDEETSSNEVLTKDANKLTLANLLNILDGSREMPGRIIVITTNHIDWIDEALLREGRIDIRVEMKRIGSNLMWDMFKNYRNANGIEITDAEIDLWKCNEHNLVEQPPCRVINKIQSHKRDFNKLIGALSNDS